MAEKRSAREEAADSPVAWFAALERAVRTNDRDLERQARRELRRLGVRVRLARREAGL